MNTPPERIDAPGPRSRPQLAGLIQIALGLVAALVVTVILFNNVVMPGFVGRGNVTRVPDVTGKELTQAQSLLTKAGLTPGETRQRNDPKPAGTVIRQQPQAGNSVKDGRPIILTVSLGEPGRSVPTLAQESIRNAELALGDVDLVLGQVTRAPTDNIPTDLVVASQPPAGTTLPRGSTVDILVSAGTSRRSAGYVMPNLVGRETRPTRDRLLDAGFKVTVDEKSFGFFRVGNTHVTEQDPEPGSRVMPWDTIWLKGE
ncbi:MAG TPA: PASTA domain-containing protein [Candidatus Eisenbacteria bacterium]